MQANSKVADKMVRFFKILFFQVYLCAGGFSPLNGFTGHDPLARSMNSGVELRQHQRR